MNTCCNPIRVLNCKLKAKIALIYCSWPYLLAAPQIVPSRSFSLATEHTIDHNNLGAVISAKKPKLLQIWFVADTFAFELWPFRQINCIQLSNFLIFADLTLVRFQNGIIRSYPKIYDCEMPVQLFVFNFTAFLWPSITKYTIAAFSQHSDLTMGINNWNFRCYPYYL